MRGATDYALTPLAILDIIAIAPTLLGFITPELYLLRIVRLARIGRVGRSKRFRKSIKHFNNALASKKEELQISAIYSGVVILISSILMFLAEGHVQREQFGSIPRCLCCNHSNNCWVWRHLSIRPWKVIAAITAICGIAVIAIPMALFGWLHRVSWVQEFYKKT